MVIKGQDHLQDIQICFKTSGWQDVKAAGGWFKELLRFLARSAVNKMEMSHPESNYSCAMLETD